MSEKETGGPAFPTYHGGYAKCDADGMTLRDYFAAKAMKAWIASTTKTYNHNGESHVDIVNVAQIARNAYAQADAMLKAREA